MRKDLAKCTTERERRGVGIPTKYGGRIKVNTDPDHEYENEFGGFRSSARHRHKYGGKDFSDVLNPLRGNIRKNLGRPWDKVFSEFCQVLDRRGLSGYHIWTHLQWEVEIKTYLGEDGKIYSKPYGYRAGHREVSGFYVHPVSGLLLYAVPERYNRRGYQAVKKLPVPGMEPMEYRKIDGLWFRCVVVRQKVYTGPRMWNWGWEEVFTQKRSCNKKEIRWIKTQV